MIIGILIAVVVIIILIFVIATYNSLNELRNLVKEAFSTIDVYLKKRWELVPNLVECVKGYADYEKSTLEEVISLRNNVYEDMSNSDKVKSGTKINEKLTKLVAIAEKYPELKANENFKKLSEQLIQIEDEIMNARKYYNGTVKKYNIEVMSFPKNIIASIFGFKPEKMFEALENEKENVKVEL